MLVFFPVAAFKSGETGVFQPYPSQEEQVLFDRGPFPFAPFPGTATGAAALPAFAGAAAFPPFA